MEFTIKLKKREAIKENTEMFLKAYTLGEMDKEDLKEMEQMAIEDEEYEVAESIVNVFKILNDKEQGIESTQDSAKM